MGKVSTKLLRGVNLGGWLGEWSLGLHGKTTQGDLKKYSSAQINAYNQCLGWFFWTYKTENMSGWSLVDCANLIL